MADYGNNKIRLITSNGYVSTFAGWGAPGDTDGPVDIATFNAPMGIAVDEDGAIFVAGTNVILFSCIQMVIITR